MLFRDLLKNSSKRRPTNQFPLQILSAWIVDNSGDEYSDGDGSDDDSGDNFPGQGSKDFELDEDVAFTKDCYDETDTASMAISEVFRRFSLSSP